MRPENYPLSNSRRRTFPDTPPIGFCALAYRIRSALQQTKGPNRTQQSNAQLMDGGCVQCKAVVSGARDSTAFDTFIRRDHPLASQTGCTLALAYIFQTSIFRDNF